MFRIISKLGLFLAFAQCSPAFAEGIMVATGTQPSDASTGTPIDDEEWICVPAGGPGSVFSVPPPQGSWSIPNADGAIILVLSADEYSAATALTPDAWRGLLPIIASLSGRIAQLFSPIIR
ncbi:MAG: hypothetical protein JKX69_12210 [Rhodobacteraceae bacterium]|nr:hypothetical protein [Paracoccaceae bacterium]